MSGRAVSMSESSVSAASRPRASAGQDRTDADERRPLFLRGFLAADKTTRAVLADLVTELTRAGLTPDDLSNAELVLAEVLNNIAEHAYGKATGPVELRVDLLRAGLGCTISDQGHPLPAGVVPDPDLPLIAPPDHLPEGGFGWHIIRCLTTDLRYARDGDWNRLSLRIPWAD